MSGLWVFKLSQAVGGQMVCYVNLACLFAFNDANLWIAEQRELPRVIILQINLEFFHNRIDECVIPHTDV